MLLALSFALAEDVLTPAESELMAQRAALYAGCMAPPGHGPHEMQCRSLRLRVFDPLEGHNALVALMPLIEIMHEGMGLSAVPGNTQGGTQDMPFQALGPDGSVATRAWLRWHEVSPGKYGSTLCLAPGGVADFDARCATYFADLAANGFPAVPEGVATGTIAGRAPKVPPGCMPKGQADSGNISCPGLQPGPMDVFSFQPLPFVPTGEQLGDVCGVLVSQIPNVAYVAHPVSCSIESKPAIACGRCDVSRKADASTMSFLAAVGDIEGMPYLLACTYAGGALPDVCGDIALLK